MIKVNPKLVVRKNKGTTFNVIARIQGS